MKAFALSLFALGISNTQAGEAEGLEALLKVLHENGTLNNAQYQTLTQALEKPAQLKPTEASAADDISAEETPLVETDGGLEVSTFDGESSFELGGRLMFDGALYQQDQVEMGSGTALRRARIEMEGTLFTDWGYKLGVDFAGGDADVKNAYIAYNGVWPWKFKLGQFKEPFSLNELTSSKHTTFIEPALPNEFAPERHLGIGVSTLGQHWTWAGGVFGEDFDGDADDEGDEAWGLSSRLTLSPIYEDRKALHFGAAFAYRVPDDERKVKFNARPESRITDVKFLDTGSIKKVDNTLLYGLEAAGVWGAFSLQSEYMQMQVQRLGDRQDYRFDGFYAYASWFLTGESRAYKFKKGRFGRVKPRHSYGAWELGLRYSQLDLNDADIEGGKAQQWSLGLNWYINKRLRVMANYIHVDNDEYADADGDVAGNDDPNLFLMRMQMDF